MYFLVSVGLLWWLLASFPNQSIHDWFVRASLTAFYLAVLGLLAVLLIPHEAFARFRQETSQLVKLGVLLNYLTLLLLLQLSVQTWWRRALTLAGLFLVSYGGAWLLSHLLWPVVAKLREVSSEAQGTHVNPSASQGRKGEMG